MIENFEFEYAASDGYFVPILEFHLAYNFHSILPGAVSTTSIKERKRISFGMISNNSVFSGDDTRLKEQVILRGSSYTYSILTYFKAFSGSFTFDYYQNGMKVLEILV